MKVGADVGKDVHADYDKAAKHKPEEPFRVRGSIIRIKSAKSLVFSQDRGSLVIPIDVITTAIGIGVR
jgi:hypothetical protein